SSLKALRRGRARTRSRSLGCALDPVGPPWASAVDAVRVTSSYLEPVQKRVNLVAFGFDGVTSPHSRGTHGQTQACSSELARSGRVVGARRAAAAALPAEQAGRSTSRRSAAGAGWGSLRLADRLPMERGSAGVRL